MPGNQLLDPGRKTPLAHLADLQPEAAQNAADAELHIAQLALQELAPDQRRARTSWASADLQWTGRNQPMRSSWAMPRASLRSVLTIIADSAALPCRVSSSPVPNPASLSPACSHCDRGPASSPMRVTGTLSWPKKRTSASGSLATLASH